MTHPFRIGYSNHADTAILSASGQIGTKPVTLLTDPHPARRWSAGLPDQTETAEEVVQRTLADCQGNRDAALLLLAHLLNEAKRSLSAGLLRLPPAGQHNRVTRGL